MTAAPHPEPRGRAPARTSRRHARSIPAGSDEVRLGGRSKRAMNSSTNGASPCSAAVASALIRNAPESLEVNSPSSSAASAISTSAGRSLAKKRLPASVSDTLRVERWKSCTLRRLSKLAKLWLRAEELRPLRRAAARNPLYSATAAKAASVSFGRNYPP